MKNYLFALLGLSTVPVLASAEVKGVWQTEPMESGAYFHVNLDSCAADAEKLCGTITEVFPDRSGAINASLLGKVIVQDMTALDEDRFGGGTVYDPEQDKTYRSKMQLENGALRVEGCVGPFCKGESWVKP